MHVIQVRLKLFDGVVQSLVTVVGVVRQEGTTHVFTGLGESSQPAVHFCAQHVSRYCLSQMDWSGVNTELDDDWT